MLLSSSRVRVGTCRAAARPTPFLPTQQPRPRQRYVAVQAAWYPFNSGPETRVSCKEQKQSETLTKDAGPVGWVQELAANTAKCVALFGLTAALLLGNSGAALAARSGGRVGGSSFSSGRASSSFSSSSSSSRSSSFGSSSSRSFAAPSYSSSPLSRSSVITRQSTVYTSPSVDITVGVPMGSGYSGAYERSTYNDFMSVVLPTIVFISAVWFIIGASSVVGGSVEARDAAAPASVAKLSVGVLASGARRLKRDLDALAEAADTGTAEGLHALMQEAALTLLRHPEYIAYGASETRGCTSASDAERQYNALSVAERAHYKEETLANVRGRGVRRAKLSQVSNDVDEYLVVTLVVAGSGTWSLPPIRDQSDVRAALRVMGGLTPSETLAVELTWTPQADGDTMTAQELLAEFPELRPL